MSAAVDFLRKYKFQLLFVGLCVVLFLVLRRCKLLPTSYLPSFCTKKDVVLTVSSGTGVLGNKLTGEVVPDAMNTAAATAASLARVAGLSSDVTNTGTGLPVKIEAFTQVKLTNYYAPWCTFSKQLMPVWEELEKHYEGSPCTVKKVDCDENKQAAQDEDIKGFPTIILEKESKKIVYSGPRTVEALKTFVDGQMAA
jgi:thiol-disulfide isomerase/thioredoxin